MVLGAVQVEQAGRGALSMAAGLHSRAAVLQCDPFDDGMCPLWPPETASWPFHAPPGAPAGVCPSSPGRCPVCTPFCKLAFSALRLAWQLLQIDALCRRLAAALPQGPPKKDAAGGAAGKKWNALPLAAKVMLVLTWHTPVLQMPAATQRPEPQCRRPASGPPLGFGPPVGSQLVALLCAGGLRVLLYLFSLCFAAPVALLCCCSCAPMYCWPCCSAVLLALLRIVLLWSSCSLTVEQRPPPRARAAP